VQTCVYAICSIGIYLQKLQAFGTFSEQKAKMTEANHNSIAAHLHIVVDDAYEQYALNAMAFWTSHNP